MAKITANNSITVAAGSSITFCEGGIGQAILDGNIYTLGMSDVFLGPFAQAETIQVLVTSGPINYYTVASPATGSNMTPVLVDPLTGVPSPSVASAFIPAIQSSRAARIAARAKGPMIVAPALAATTAYTAGQVRRLPSGHHIACYTSGTSGGSAPTFDAARPITDGTVTWRYSGVSKTASDSIVPTVTTAASAAAAGLTETRFHTATAATQFVTTRNAVGVSVSNALISGFSAATGPSTGSGNATTEAGLYGLTGEVFSRYWPEAECYITDTHVSLTFHNPTGPVWVEIDDQLVEADPTSHNGTSGGLVKFDFGVYDRRKVRFIQVGQNYQVRGVALSTNGRVEAAETIGDSWIYFGDSFGNTISPADQDSPAMSGIIRSLRRALGIESMVDMTVGGSGYVSQNANTYKVPAMLESPGNNTLFSVHNPKHIVTAAGFNDRDNADRTLVRSEALRTWRLARNKFPQAKITIVGAWPGATGPDANTISLNADLQADFTAWGDSNARYLNPAKSVAEAWTNGDGSTGEAIGGSSGSASMYTGTDTLHPSPYGGKSMGERLAAEIAAAWADGF